MLQILPVHKLKLIRGLKKGKHFASQVFQLRLIGAYEAAFDFKCPILEAVSPLFFISCICVH
jgi:hypothetical protein